MPRPLGWTPTTPVDDVNLNANTKDVIGDLDQLNPIYFPNNNLVSAINAVPSIMKKTFYVDAVNGNDANDGSKNAPFKTLKKAVDSVPVGGKGTIYLTSSQIFEITSDIIVHNKFIWFRPTISNSHYTIRPQVYVSEDYNCMYTFQISKTGIVFDYAIIEMPSKADASLSWHWYAGKSAFFNGKMGVGHSQVSCSNSTIILPSDTNIFCDGGGLSAWYPFITLSMKYTSIIRDGGYLYSMSPNGIGTLSVHNISLKDSNDNSVSWSSVIKGIVKDSNGVPRNIVSNIIF